MEKLDLSEIVLIGTLHGRLDGDGDRGAQHIAPARSSSGLSRGHCRARCEGPADIFLMAPEEIVRAIYHDPAIAEKLLAVPPTPEAIDIG